MASVATLALLAALVILFVRLHNVLARFFNADTISVVKKK
jgi:hypothetical protein